MSSKVPQVTHRISQVRSFKGFLRRYGIAREEEIVKTQSVPLTSERLRRFGLASGITRAQSAVSRIRVTKNGETVRDKKDGLFRGSGSAYGISPRHLITCNHVAQLESLGDTLWADFPVPPSRKSPDIFIPIELVNPAYDTNNGENDNKIEVFSLPVTIHKRFPKYDLAILEVDPLDNDVSIPHVDISPTIPENDDIVFIIGHKSTRITKSGNKHNYITGGEIISIDDIMGTRNKRIKIEIKIQDEVLRLVLLREQIMSAIGSISGQSGGLLCNIRGEACGVVKFVLGTEFTVSWAILRST